MFSCLCLRENADTLTQQPAISKWLLLNWLLHKLKKNSLIPTLRSENLADILTECFCPKED